MSFSPRISGRAEVSSYWAEVHTPKNERSIQAPAHESIEFI